MTELQPIRNDATISGQEKTGIGIHGYWMSEKGKRTDLSLRSGLVTRAGVVEYRDRKSKGEKVVIFANLDHLWGPDEPAEGNLIKQRLDTRYGVSSEDIVVRQDAWSTGGEVKSFAEEATKRGWGRLVDIAFRPHIALTIPNIYKKLGIKPHFETAEDILREKDVHKFKRTYKIRRVLNIDKNGNPTPWKQVPIADRQYEETGEERTINHQHNHTARLVKNLTWSKFGAVYWFYEGIKWGIMHAPGFSYDKLEQKNKETRAGKGTDSPISRRLGRYLDFDVYTLNGRRSPFTRKG